jgi:hypothetical protein
LKCCDLERIKKFGLTLEEFSIIAKCNGIFNEVFRPDEDEILTENTILENIKKLKTKKIEILSEYASKVNSIDSNPLENKNTLDNLYYDKNEILQHNPYANEDCKEKNTVLVKKCNLDFFRVSLYASVRRHRFFLVTNTSRKALKQTGDGHFSCITSYNEKSDHLLMLDTARFKYNSLWLDLKNVYESFLPLDNQTKKFRGFSLCSKYF